jgi:unsaturated rhamnogalacturonyl hydrolase
MLMQPRLRAAGLGVILGVAAPWACGGGGGGEAGSGGSGGAVAGTGGAAHVGAGGLAAAGGRDGSAGSNVGTAGVGGSGTLAASSLAVRFANAVMTRWPDPLSMPPGALWEYNHGIVLRGMEQVYRRTSDRRILAYIQRYADELVSAAGVVNIPAPHSFDNIQPSVLLPFLFQQTGLAKYRTAAEQILARYNTIPRNADGGFWHKETYPNQMWLDSIYMGLPFLTRYDAVFGTCGAFCDDTVVEQVLLVAVHVRDTTTGLLYHAWDDSPMGSKAVWANTTTGRSPIIWGRAMGWYAMALVDMLPDLPVDHPGRAEMISILAALASALQATQDPVTGLWFQVLDQGNLADNWLETSASGMFIYALKVAVNRGYVNPSYLAVANRAWQGVRTRVTTDPNGLPTITGAVQGMSVGINYAAYINQLPTLANSSHGLCAILLAAAEMEAE